jgi:ribosomal protein L19E
MTEELNDTPTKDELEQLIRDDLIKELKEHHNEQMNAVLIHPEVYKYLTRKSHKKIKRRLFYEVIWWGAERRYTKCFYSVNKMRKFVNELHLWYNDYIEIEKTWCYREFTPRHKWYYVSYRPNQFIVVEKY